MIENVLQERISVTDQNPYWIKVIKNDKLKDLDGETCWSN
jgi:hypothetical protein